MVRRFPYPSTLVALSVLSVLLCGIGAAQSARHPSVTSAATSDLTVTVGTAFAFTLSSDEITPGSTVTLTIVQTDDVAHTFTLSSVANYTFPATASSQDISSYFAAHAPLVNVTIPSGQTTFATTFVAPPYGEYEYVCTVPGHFQAGMVGVLGSGEHGVSVAPSTGPGAPVFIIGGFITGLVVLAIVLGFVIGRRRGSHDEMPPERLGYPETVAERSPPSH